MKIKGWLLILFILLLSTILGVIKFESKHELNIPEINIIQAVKIIPQQGPGAIKNNNIAILDLNNKEDRTKVVKILMLLKNANKSQLTKIPASNGSTAPYLIIQTTVGKEIDLMTTGVNKSEVLASDNENKEAYKIVSPELNSLINNLLFL